MKKKTILVVTFILPLLLLWAGAAVSQDRDAVVDSMKQRYPALLEAKNNGLVGEAWTGLVDVVKPDAPARVKSFVNAENNDRRTLFQIIAKETGTPITEVAVQNRIRQYRLAGDNHFVQDKNRNWVKKGRLQ